MKIDQLLNSQQRLSGRYFLYDFETPAVLVPGNFLATRNAFLARSQNATLNHSWTLNPRLINSFTLWL